MKTHLSDPPFLTRQRHLWRVSQFSTRRPQVLRTHIRSLGRITFVDGDEDALVAFRPGRPLHCYQCDTTSDDPNPTYEYLMATEGSDYGLPPYGCKHIEEVVGEIDRRCGRGEP